VNDGLALLRARFSALPELLREALERLDAPAPFDPDRVRRIVTTGIGSSAGHARYLAHVLSESLGLPARFSPTGALASGPPPGALRDALIVFSQGLSPNARYALAHAEAWGSVVLVTAQRAGDPSDDRTRWFESLQTRGAVIVDLAAPDEFGTLVRIQGPMLGYAAALSIARSLARAAGADAPELAPDAARVEARVRSAADELAAALPEVPIRQLLANELVLLASSGYGELVQNLRTKLLEGMLRPLPPLWDGLEFAHGGLQQMWSERAVLIQLARAGDPADRDLTAALHAACDRERHVLVRLEARECGPAAVFEHEAMLDVLLLRWLEEGGSDPRRWPAQQADRPLYDRTPELPEDAEPCPRALEPAPALERWSWPELERHISGGECTAVVALGSIEQHGPHLPLGTDSWIAQWLAERVAARLEGAVQVPVVPLGCASEHAAFPGTISLAAETFERLLSDVLRSLAAHGFASAFVFSAHGGNLGVLRRAASELERAAEPMRVVVYDAHGPLAQRLAACGRRHGVSAQEQGQHAGELETSIVRALAPGRVAMRAAAPGLLVGESDAQEVFYPSLRENAPSGVVGDPRRADAGRADGYLEAWTDELVGFYRSRIAK